MTVVPVENGLVVSVAEEVSGDELAADAAAGATSLTLTDAVDFDEDGGQALIAAEVVTYTTADLDADVLWLAAPLVGSYLVGEGVAVDPEARERVATVSLDVDGEAISARIPHALYDRLPEGIRDVPERVTLAYDGGEWVVEDVLGLVPLVDASFLDPATIPPSSGDDVVPPAPSGVTLQSGIGSVFVKWQPVVNADPVLTYRVYAHTTTPVLLDAAHLLGEVDGTLFVARKMGDGTPIPTGTDTQFAVVAVDVDGPGPATEVAGRAALITGPDIAVNTVTANEIAANAITTSELAADAVTATHLAATAITAKHTITGATLQTEATANRGVKVLSTGIRAWTAAGVETVTVNASDGRVTLRGIHLTGQEDVGVGAITPGNEPPIRIGTLTGQHIRMDGNEIQAMSTGSAAGTLHLNANGGVVNVGVGASDVFIGGATAGQNVQIGGSGGLGTVTALDLIKAGKVAVNLAVLGTVYTASVTFGTGFPTGAPVPNIVVTPEIAFANPGLIHVGTLNISRTGFSIKARKDSGTTGSFDFHWIAVAT